MRRVIRRALGAGVLVLLLLAASPAAAAVPEGPRLAVVKASPKPPRLELVSVNRKGGDPLRLAGDGERARPFLNVFAPLNIFAPISWSSDGERLAFGGAVGFGRGDDPEPIEKLFVVGADGKGLQAIPGTKGGIGPVFSPDGRTVAFTRSIERRGPITLGGRRWERGFRGSSIWTVDLVTGVRRQLTPWVDGVDYAASSFSPDGTTLLATHEDERLLHEAEPVVLDLVSGGSRRLLDDGFAPVYSPDGSRVALVRRIERYGKEEGEGMDLYVVNADGSGLRRLTRTPDLFELSPSWDPSGERLAYARLPAERREDAPFGFRSVLMQVNADGTCKTKVASAARTFYFLPTWQPGPGREAGRIGC